MTKRKKKQRAMERRIDKLEGEVMIPTPYPPRRYETTGYQWDHGDMVQPVEIVIGGKLYC